MRLKPVENSPEPDYPDYDKFHHDRREFLARMGAIAGALLAGAGLAGCGKGESGREEPQHLGGVIAPPRPPSPPPPPPGPDQDPPGERLRGEVAAPDPIGKSPEPRIAGGMRAPCPPGEKEEEPLPFENPDAPEPPKESPK